MASAQNHRRRSRRGYIKSAVFRGHGRPSRITPAVPASPIKNFIRQIRNARARDGRVPTVIGEPVER